MRRILFFSFLFLHLLLFITHLPCARFSLINSQFYWTVVICQSNDVEVAEAVEGGDLGIVGDDVQDFGDGSFAPAPGVDTVCVFPKNPKRSK